MLNKIKSYFLYLNKYGIAVPMIRDPQTGLGSVSLSMLFISFNVVLFGLIGKWSKYLDIDIQQAIYWFMVCSGLYFGRSLSKTGNSVEINNKEENKS